MTEWEKGSVSDEIGQAAHGAYRCIQAGKAVLARVAGAVGGPVGAALSTVWEHRRAVAAVLIAVALILVVVSLAALSLPAAFLTADNPVAELTGQMEELRIGLERCRSDAREAIGNRIQSGAYDVARSWAAYVDRSASPTDAELCFLLAVWSVSNCDWQAFCLLLDGQGAILYPVQAVEREDDGMFYLAATLEPLCVDAAWELLAVDPNAICPDTGLGNRQTSLMRYEGMKRMLTEGKNGRSAL